MFEDDFDKLMKELDRYHRRAMLATVLYLFFMLVALVAALATFTGCSHPGMTDREAAAIVELLKD